MNTNSTDAMRRVNQSGDDHALDALRYAVMSGIKVAKSLSQVKARQMMEQKNYDDVIDNLRAHPDYWLYQ